MNNPWAMPSRGLLTALALGCFCSLSGCLALPPEVPGADADESVLGKRLDFSATRLLDGHVLVVGGQGGGETLNDAYLYHPDTGRWTATGSLHQGRTEHESLLLPSGQVLVLGGKWVDPSTKRSSAVFEMELYDPASGQWSLATPMPQLRSFTQATLLRNGMVLVTGGATSSGVTARVDLYNPLTNQWSECAPMRLSRSGHSALLLPDGQVLVAGGQRYDELSEAEVYDPDTNTWAFTWPMTYRYSQASAYSRPDGRVFLMEGGPGEFYDPASHTWSVVPIYETGSPPGSFSTRTPLPDGRVLYSGGLSGPDLKAFTNHMKAYDMRINRWVSLAPMPEARVNHKSVLFPDGKVLMMGGEAPGRKEPRQPVMTYDSHTDTWE